MISYFSLSAPSSLLSKNYSGLVVFLHGLGDMGKSWADFFHTAHSKHPDVFSNRPVTINMGMKMPAWYDIVTLDERDPKDDRRGFEESSNAIKELIDDLKARHNIPASKIFLGGFSQGGAVALYTLLSGKLHPVSGLILLSSYLPFSSDDFLLKNIKDDVKCSVRDVPVFWGHGSADPLIPERWGRMSAERLESIGAKVQFASYKGLEHSASHQEMIDVLAFINKFI